MSKPVVEGTPTMPPRLPATPPPVRQAGSTREIAKKGLIYWFFSEGPWWLSSFIFHVILIGGVALLGGRVVSKIVDEAPAFEEVETVKAADVPLNIERFEVGETPYEPSELNTETLTLEPPGEIAQEERFYDDSPSFSPQGSGMLGSGGGEAALGGLGGLGGFDIKGVGSGPARKGRGGVGAGFGPGINPGSGGGEGWGFGSRGAGQRKALLASGGGTRQSERAVAAALNWLARHQLPNGSWNLQTYLTRCSDGSCTGPGRAGEHPAAATAFGLLPFLGAGQTHQSKGPYKKNISAAVYYLVSNQTSDGDLRLGGTMYDHALATLALCECYGMSNDQTLRPHAQAALNFLMDAQDPKGGGWRYEPQQPGDTSVTGWQIMALKSGQMAYLTVKPNVLENAKLFLKSVSSGPTGVIGGGLFGYTNPQIVGLANTAVGLLCYQYLIVPRDDPAMRAGTEYLMKNLPDLAERNIYYWYYATMVMHNQPGQDWDTWNRKMRRILIDTQCKDGCAAGSWDPKTPTPDKWGESGGRLMMTSLSALTLEVYYRYLPLYKLDKQ